MCAQEQEIRKTWGERGTAWMLSRLAEACLEAHGPVADPEWRREAIDTATVLRLVASDFASCLPIRETETGRKLLRVRGDIHA